MTDRRYCNQLFFPRPPHFSKFILLLLSVKTQLVSDKISLKKITLKYFSFKLEVWILSESKMGYVDWRVGGLSSDVDEDFEQFNSDFLQIVGIERFQNICWHWVQEIMT